MDCYIHLYFKLCEGRYLSGMHITIVTFLLAFSANFSQAQCLKLYNVNTTQSRNIVSTKNVSIITHDQDAGKIKGNLYIVNDSTIRIDSLEIPIADIASMKVITNKSRMWGYIFAGGSAFFLGSGILILATSGGGDTLAGTFGTIFGVQFILNGVAASVPAIRFLFRGKTYKKSAGWELQIHSP